jgi:hypothetical protein
VSVCSEPTWQAISALATIATLIDEGLRDAREHYATLFAAQPDPHALDNARSPAYSASTPTASRAATSTNGSYGAGAANT